LTFSALPSIGIEGAPSPLTGILSADDAAVSVRGLVKRYKDGTEANRGINLDLRRGEIMAILGPNGAGKTTFLRQVTTELRPTSGRVLVFGIDPAVEPERARRMMGITPQEAGLFDSLRLQDHLQLFARLKGLSHRAAAAAAARTIEELDLAADARRRVGTLSGGQRRRVLLGLALVGQPPLLVLDEPTTGLDPAARRALWGILRRAVAEGASVILSTHSMEEAERLSDRVGIIVAGRLIVCATVTDLTARAALEDTYLELVGQRWADDDECEEAG
jgi:ABC-2 type transport system ATP-binding protein